MAGPDNLKLFDTILPAIERKRGDLEQMLIQLGAGFNGLLSQADLDTLTYLTNKGSITTILSDLFEIGENLELIIKIKKIIKGWHIRDNSIFEGMNDIVGMMINRKAIALHLLFHILNFYREDLNAFYVFLNENLDMISLDRKHESENLVSYEVNVPASSESKLIAYLLEHIQEDDLFESSIQDIVTDIIFTLAYFHKQIGTYFSNET